MIRFALLMYAAKNSRYEVSKLQPSSLIALETLPRISFNFNRVRFGCSRDACVMQNDVRLAAARYRVSQCQQHSNSIEAHPG